MKRLLTVGTMLSLLLLLLVATPVSAVTSLEGDTIVIEADEVIDDDVFIGANRIEVNGTINGDLMFGANEIVINGDVNGNVFGGGALITVNGDIDGSMFTGGQLIKFGPESSVAGSVYGVGNSIEFASGSAVARSIYGSGFQILLNGQVGRDVNVGGSAVALNGTILGDANLNVASAEDVSDFDPEQMEEIMRRFNPNMPDLDIDYITPGVTIGDESSVGGDINYSSTNQFDFGGFEPEGSINVEVTADTARGSGLWGRITARLGEFIALAIIGSLLLWLWPQLPKTVGRTMRERFLPSAGWGALSSIVFMIAIPIAILLLILFTLLTGIISFGQLAGTVLSFGGLGLFAAMVAFGFIAFSVSKIAVSTLIGNELINRDGSGNPYVALLVGLFIYQIIRAIPVLGFVIAVIVGIAGVGACIIWLRNRNQQGQAMEAAV